MAEEETVAVLDPETTVEDEAPQDIEETAEEPTEETEEQEEGSETYTAEDLERVAKETEEKIRAEAREQAEAAQLEIQRNQNRAFLNEVGMSQIRNLVLWAGKQVNDGKDPEAVAAQVQRVAVQTHIEQMQGYVLQETFDQLANHFDTFVQKKYPDYRPDNAALSKYTKEVASKQAERAYMALYERMLDTILAVEVPKRLEEERKAAETKAKKGETVQKLQNPPKVATPAKVNGELAGRTYSNMQALDSAFANDEITFDEYRRNRAKLMPKE